MINSPLHTFRFIVLMLIIGTSFLIPAKAKKNSVPVVMVDQGSDWTPAARQDFYSRDQGARIMPHAWMQALSQSNGNPFMEDSLDRYGYLPNTQSSFQNIPVGFNLAEENGQSYIGMTCSACHTRQIEVQGIAYRLDGGPAIADFQSFLRDLDLAVGHVLENDGVFDNFAKAVLGSSYSDLTKNKLRIQVDAWYLPYHTLISRSLPDKPWGPSRLDAVSMIFNRLTGLDIGQPPSYIIEDNILKADAPVRYPFLWNAAVQDMTQWPGFADNGNSLLGLARNLGEVYGVFAIFHPKKGRFWGIEYLDNNSANFDGLKRLEELVWKIGAPAWPWQLDQSLVQKGEKLFNWETAQGGCVECHGKRTGKFRSISHKTLATPVLDVGTDTREHNLLGRKAKSGVLEGAKGLPVSKPLKSIDLAFNILGTAVTGTIVQHYTHFLSEKDSELFMKNLNTELPPELKDLEGAFRLPETFSMQPQTSKLKKETGRAKYESRVLEGIWAAAPYLHNGSVPTLTELLKPASERVGSFQVGPAYDIENVGLSAIQTKFDYTLITTGCDQLNSGNSNCGHEYGTSLSADQKRALLEYLKSL